MIPAMVLAEMTVRKIKVWLEAVLAESQEGKRWPKDYAAMLCLFGQEQRREEI